MEEKNYTLTEKELFDLIEYEVNATICATVMRAINDYHADGEMISVLLNATKKGNRLADEMPRRSETLIDIFNLERIGKERVE